MTDAFASKAGDYARYRADYPRPVIEWMATRARLTADSAVVDLGSGTGLLSKHLVHRVKALFAVEPSPDMREYAESLFSGSTGFRSVDGAAEKTNLPPSCADAIVCGNAFHYFEPVQTRTEALRILRGRQTVVIAFHTVPKTLSAFMRDYLDFVASVTPPGLSQAHSLNRHEHQWQAFFGADSFESIDFGDSVYPLSWTELRGRFASTSVAPLPTDPSYPSVVERLVRIFSQHQENGTVPFLLRWAGVSGDLHSQGGA